MTRSAGREDKQAAELEALTAVTPADIARARQAWERSASPQFRGLLDATPIDLAGPEPLL